MDDCIFCKIVKGEEEAQKVKETDNFLVIKDINPQAAIHLLILPKKHFKDITEISDVLWQELKTIVIAYSREKGLKGFRLVHNSGEAAQIPHMQVHLLADVTPERAM